MFITIDGACKQDRNLLIEEILTTEKSVFNNMFLYQNLEICGKRPTLPLSELIEITKKAEMRAYASYLETNRWALFDQNILSYIPTNIMNSPTTRDINEIKETCRQINKIHTEVGIIETNTIVVLYKETLHPDAITTHKEEMLQSHIVHLYKNLYSCGYKRNTAILFIPSTHPQQIQQKILKKYIKDIREKMQSYADKYITATISQPYNTIKFNLRDIK